MPSLDFKSMVKAERAKARGQLSSKVHGSVSTQGSSQPAAAEHPALSFRLPEAKRPNLSDDGRVAAAPSSVWHLPCWVTKEEEEAMLRCADHSPQERWVQLRGRRLQNLGGLPRVSS